MNHLKRVRREDLFFINQSLKLSLFLVHTDPIYDLSELEELFELPLISPFNVLREQIVKYIEFRMPTGYARDVKPLEFIRLYDMEEDQPVSIIHEPLLTTLK